MLDMLKRKVNNRPILQVAVSRTLKQLLLIDAIRYAVGYSRYFYLSRIKRNFRTLNAVAADTHKDSLAYNSRSLSSFAVIRSNQLLRPLSVIDQLYKRLEDVTVLSIGPRTEGEILNIVAHGFSRKNIEAIDLFSYSPWIRVGDMHQAPYTDNSFDVVMSGWQRCFLRRIVRKLLIPTV